MRHVVIVRSAFSLKAETYFFLEKHSFENIAINRGELSFNEVQWKTTQYASLSLLVGISHLFYDSRTYGFLMPLSKVHTTLSVEPACMRRAPDETIVTHHGDG